MKYIFHCLVQQQSKILCSSLKPLPLKYMASENTGNKILVKFYFPGQLGTKSPLVPPAGNVADQHYEQGEN